MADPEGLGADGDNNDGDNNNEYDNLDCGSEPTRDEKENSNALLAELAQLKVEMDNVKEGPHRFLYRELKYSVKKMRNQLNEIIVDSEEEAFKCFEDFMWSSTAGEVKKLWTGTVIVRGPDSAELETRVEEVVNQYYTDRQRDNLLQITVED